MRKRPMLALATGALLAAMLPGTTSAAQPQPITIESHTERGCPTSTSCVFTASGAINAAGTVESTPVVVAALGSPKVGTAQWIKTYRTADGSFTIRLEARVTVNGDSLQLPETGRWVVIDATGAYAGLQGAGSQSGIRDYDAESLDVTLTGKVQLG